MAHDSEFNSNPFRRTESQIETAQAHSISTYSYPQATTIPTDRFPRSSRRGQGAAQNASLTNHSSDRSPNGSAQLHPDTPLPSANSKVPTIHSQGYSIGQECNDQVPTSGRGQRKSRTRNATYERSVPVDNISTTPTYTLAEQMAKEKSGSDRSAREEIPLKGTLYDPIMHYEPPTPPQSPQMLPAPSGSSIFPKPLSNVCSYPNPVLPSSNHRYPSGSLLSFGPITPESLDRWKAAGNWHMLVTLPTLSPPSSERTPKGSPEMEPNVVNLSTIHGSGAGDSAPSQPYGYSFKPEYDIVDVAAIYNSAEIEMLYEPQPKFSRVTLAAFSISRVDKYRLNRFEKPSRRSTRNSFEELSMHPETELDELRD
ncbi:unnamed protein product [Rhizoctonia solani]|uniref:Velvet domain-containing protein n=1 Tax=Rhizoctonia solani TaxID=456999 RepID=A0A8H3BC16_9AGAM|nr:unnamed protein product [Rhizoctonia solani]